MATRAGIRVLSRGAALCAVAVCAAMLSGCGPHEPPAHDGSPLVTMVDSDPRLLSAHTSGAVDIRYSGTIAYDETNRCLFLDHYNSYERAVLIWPAASIPIITADGRRGADVLAAGVVAEGDRVLIAGFGGPFGVSDFGQPPEVPIGSEAVLECIRPGDLVVSISWFDEIER